MLHVPIECRWHTDKAHRFGSRRGIEHNDVVALFAAILVYVHHGAQFFHAGQDRKFLCLHTADASGAQHRCDIRGNFLPMALDFFLDVEFLDPKPIGDLQRIRSLQVKEFGV